MKKLLNGRKVFYLNEIGCKRSFMLSMMKPLNLEYKKFDMCPNFCMLYYLENTELTNCRTYRHTHSKPRTGRGRTFVAHRKLRYLSITPRQQRFLMTLKIVENKIWHHSHDVVDWVMVHYSNVESWKHFNMVHLQFSVESRNICLGLCIDGFNPFGTFIAPYSCWPVILEVYNLPLGICMRLKFMFLSMVILDPNWCDPNTKGSIGGYGWSSYKA